MVLYTIVPVEAIFPGGVEPEAPAPIELAVAGRLCTARRGPDGQLRLERVLSTEPSDFLNPQLAPGTVLSD